MDKSRVGLVLRLVALVAGVVGFATWAAETDRVEHEQQVENISAAFQGAAAEEVEPNRAPSFGLFGVSAVAAVCSAIFFASVKPDPSGVEPSSG